LKKLIFLVMVLIPNLVFGKQVSDLDELVKLALQNNPEIEMVRKKKNISEYEFKKAIGEFLPSLKLEYSKNHLSNVPSFNFNFGVVSSEFSTMNKNFYDFKLSLTQPIFMGGKLILNYKIKEKKKEVVYYELQEKVLEIVKNIKKDYYELCEARSNVEIAKKFLEAAKEHLKTVESFYSEGLIPRRELLEAKVKLFEARERLENAKNFYEISLEKLRKDVGVENLEVKAEKLSYEPLNLSLEELLNTAYKVRPIFKYLKLLEDTAKYGEKIAYGQFLPNLLLNLSYEKTDQYVGDEYSATSFSLILQFPIFEGGKRYWDLKVAKEKENEVQTLIKKTRDLVRLQVVSAFKKLKSCEKRIETAKRMVEEAEELLKTSKERYKEQVGTSTEVVDAIAYYVKAKEFLNSAIANYNKALADLEYAVGVEKF